MSITPCIIPPEMFDCRVDKSSLELISISLQHAQTRSLGDHISESIVSTPSHFSESWTSQMAILNGLSSPISALPEELLIIIFDDVIAPEASPHDGWRLSSPRSLASVSRAWRTIVFACPKLWRHVHVTPAQSIYALKEQLHQSSPLLIHVTVHQWPFRNTSAASIAALGTQLKSILSPSDKEGIPLAPASQRIGSITINATERSTFLNFVLQTWTGHGSKFPALRNVTVNGSVCATWSRSCFFDSENAPGLERFELSNVVVAHSGYRLPCGIGSNLTTLVWTAPVHKHGSLVVSVSCFYRIVSSFPSLTTLELREHVVALEFATFESLERSGVTPLMHIRDLRISGRVFLNAQAAYILFHLLPSLRHVTVRGRACSGPPELRTVTLALQGLIDLPKAGWPIVLPCIEDLELECVEESYENWEMWCEKELELWKQWRKPVADMGREDITKTRVHMVNKVDKVGSLFRVFGSMPARPAV